MAQPIHPQHEEEPKPIDKGVLVLGAVSLVIGTGYIIAAVAEAAMHSSGIISDTLGPLALTALVLCSIRAGITGLYRRIAECAAGMADARAGAREGYEGGYTDGYVDGLARKPPRLRGAENHLRSVN